MSATVTNEKTNSNIKTDVLLAEKTLEIVRVIEMSDLLLRTKFSNDPTCWMNAMFHILMLRNSTYLWEERDSLSETQELCHKVHNNLSRIYSDMEACKRSSGEYIKNYSDFILARNAMIKLFGKFTNLLIKIDDSAADGSDILDEMKLILNNVTKLISKYEPENVTKTANSKEVGEGNGALSVASSITSFSMTGTTHIGENSVKNCGVNSQFSAIHNDVEMEMKNSSHYCNPVFSTHSRKTQLKDASVPANQTSTTTNTMPTVSKASRSLSEGDRSCSADSLNKFPSHLLTVDSIQKYLKSTLGNKSDAFEVKTNRDFYCKMCNCEISALRNVFSHATGKQHLKSLDMKKMRAAKGPAGSQFASIESVEERLEAPQSTRSDTNVLQISDEAITVNNLIL
jgi:hypothetical protein